MGGSIAAPKTRLPRTSGHKPLTVAPSPHAAVGHLELGVDGLSVRLRPEGLAEIARGAPLGN